MMGPGSRVALYYVPLPEDPLYARGATWLGRDPQSTATLTQPKLPDIVSLTAEPRLYGFHATLKPPMHLAAGHRWNDVLRVTRELTERIAPFALPDLAVSDIFGFLALRERSPCPQLQRLADACVAHLDPFRAPPSAEVLARRRRGGLTEQQDAMLRRWGYPYVFETWFFHMTLTRRLSADEKAVYQPAAERYFNDVLTLPRIVSDICLFLQPAPEEPFAIAERLMLRG